MFTNIHELRDLFSLMINVIDERDYLIEENIRLREKLKQKEHAEMEMYHKNTAAAAEILNILIEKADKTNSDRIIM